MRYLASVRPHKSCDFHVPVETVELCRSACIVTRKIQPVDRLARRRCLAEHGDGIDRYHNGIRCRQEATVGIVIAAGPDNDVSILQIGQRGSGSGRCSARHCDENLPALGGVHLANRNDCITCHRVHRVGTVRPSNEQYKNPSIVLGEFGTRCGADLPQMFASDPVRYPYNLVKAAIQLVPW